MKDNNENIDIIFIIQPSKNYFNFCKTCFKILFKAFFKGFFFKLQNYKFIFVILLLFLYLKKLQFFKFQFI